MRTPGALLLGLALTFVNVSPSAHAEETDPVAELAIALQEQVATIVVNDKTECEKMASDLGAFVTAHQRDFAAVAEWSKHLTPGQKKAYLAKYGARLYAVSQKLTSNVQACIANPRVMQALQRIEAASK